MNNLFATKETTPNVTAGRQLTGTAKLTELATVATESMMSQMYADIETYTNDIIASQKDSAVLDKLINTLVDFESIDAAFLNSIDDATVDNMLKSQQSKRSRTKSKLMDEANYKTMVTAAIAEHIIRKATGKDKSHYARVNGTVSYDEARLTELARDQEQLRREIRNIQSKKSIMKSKADFNETDERWQALLVAEAQLKEIRTDLPDKKDEVRNKLKELLAEVDPNKLKTADLKDIMENIKMLAFADVTTNEGTEPVVTADPTVESEEK